MITGFSFDKLRSFDWTTAESKCVEMNAHLATVHSMAHNAFIKEQMIARYVVCMGCAQLNTANV